VTGTPAKKPLPIRDDLKGLHPYGAPQLDVRVQLNTNENPYGPSESLQNAIAEAVRAVAGTLNRYLGHGLTEENTWAANGSNEVIQQLLQAFGGPGRTALGFEPSYSMHPLISLATCTEWIAGSRDADYGLSTAAEQVARHRPDVTFITSPNNPTGTSVPLDLVADAYDATRGMLVVDEAYAEFSRDGTPSALTLLPGRERLVVCRTMSKAFAAAGTRLGYLAADPAVADALLRVRLPYHLSTVTQAVARTALAHTQELLSSVQALRAERDAVVTWLRGQGLTAADSDANFVLFGTFEDRHKVWQSLLDRSVLIRETGPAGWLRVSVGTAQEMSAFRDALTEVLGQ